jgi:hypothetical protein
MQFVTSTKLIHVSASECHPQGVYRNKSIQVQHANPGADYDTCEGKKHLHWHGGLVFLCHSRIPKDGTSEQKHVGG